MHESLERKIHLGSAGCEPIEEQFQAETDRMICMRHLDNAKSGLSEEQLQAEADHTCARTCHMTRLDSKVSWLYLR